MIVDYSEAIAEFKVTWEILSVFKSDHIPRIIAFLKCYQRLTCARTYTEVEKVKAEFGGDICKAVWGFVGEQEQNRIKEMPR